MIGGDRLIPPEPVAAPANSILTHLWLLELARELGAKKAEPTGDKVRCPICDQLVDAIRFQNPRLGSAGDTYMWQTAAAWAHSRACYRAAQEAADAKHAELEARREAAGEPAIDPWEA